MPKSPVAHGAGNVNMKGKKHKTMRCGCCYCIDFREDELKKEHQKEIRNYHEQSRQTRFDVSTECASR